MRRIRAFAVCISLLLAPFSADASKEGVLKLGEFRLVSPGIGDSGQVILEGRQSREQFIALTVKAFGKSISLSKEQLKEIKAGFVNGVRLSYESGYAQLGGRTIYVTVSKGFTSGTQDEQTITINEQGGVRVEDAAIK